MMPNKPQVILLIYLYWRKNLGTKRIAAQMECLIFSHEFRYSQILYFYSHFIDILFVSQWVNICQGNGLVEFLMIQFIDVYTHG